MVNKNVFEHIKEVKRYLHQLLMLRVDLLAKLSCRISFCVKKIKFFFTQKKAILKY